MFSSIGRLSPWSLKNGWRRDAATARRRTDARKVLSRALQVEGLEERRVFAAAILNELVVDPNGTDTNFEYIEIKGTPGATLSNLYFTSIEGDSPGAGLADLVVNLSGSSLGSNGLLVITSGAPGFTFAPETTVVNVEALTLENGTNSFALISSLTTINQGSDLDTNNDGILNLPADAVLVDAVGWSDGGLSDLAYGAILSQSATLPPGAATRFLHDNRPNTAAAWYNGDLLAPNSGTSYTTTAASLSANFPAGGAITPGTINVPGDLNLAPTGVADAYQVEPSGLLTVNAGSGVLSNDTDPNGVNSLLAAVLIAGPVNASAFVLNDDGSFSYTNNGVAGVDSFTYQATDLNLFSSTVTVSINVAANTNVGPTLTIPAGTLSYTENAAGVILAATGTVTDTDSANFGAGSLTVDLLANGSLDDRLEVNNQGSGAGQIGVVGSLIQYEGVTIGSAAGGDGVAPLVVTLNSNASLASVQALFRNVTFRNVSDNPTTLTRTVRFVANDGDGGPSGGISNTVTRDIEVVAVNDAPNLMSSRAVLNYASGGEAVTLDGLISVSDVDSPNLDGGSLTVTISSGSLSGDSLAIRNLGTGVGQVGISGNLVSYGGVNVGSFSGGSAGSPLVVTLNASADAVAVQAIARAVTFQTTNMRLVPTPRTIEFVANDGDGGTSNATNFTVTQSLIRRYGFQEGVDNGQGLYAGTSDVGLAQNQPDTVTTGGLLVDFDTGTVNSAVLMRFDNLVGNGPGQIPPNAQVVAARLVVNTTNPGDGGSFHRMLTAWDQNTATWNSIPTTLSVNAYPIRNNDVTARAIFDSQVGGPTGGGDALAGVTTIGVKADVQAWVNGETNYGWLMQGWEGQTDGWNFTNSENGTLQNRPRLEVDWIPASVNSASFQQGVNGYTGTVDTALTQATPDTDNSVATGMMFSDYNDVGATNNTHVVMRFDQINGALPGQVPTGAYIHGAALTLASTANNGAGDGGQFYALRNAWPALPTWNGFVDGIQADGIEAAVNPTTVAGNPSLSPNVDGGWNTFYVTSDVQDWTSGAAANNGWGILPWVGGSDGWGITPSEATDPRIRPQLQVFFTPVGISVSPTSGLTTTEAGGTASFNVVLNTPPTADVTIGVSSSDTSEGTVSVSQLTFNASNWDIPQTVTVTGVDDALDDGDISYQIVLAAAISGDLNYGGLDPADVSVINTDNDTASASNVVNRQLFYNNATGSLFGNGSGNPTNAIDTSKVAVLPGQNTGFTSYTNYIRGLNGLIVDIDNLPGVPTVSDFAFATWDGINASNFQPTAAVPTIEVFDNGGNAGSDRVKLTFADNAIRNTWLRVTVLANGNTGLTSNDVFYFGNAVGDFNTGNLAGPPVTVRTNATDTSAVRQNQSTVVNSALITNIYDINKDGRVNATDTSLVRQNQASGLIRYFTAPAALQLAWADESMDYFAPRSSDADEDTDVLSSLADQYFAELGR